MCVQTADIRLIRLEIRGRIPSLWCSDEDGTRVSPGTLQRPSVAHLNANALHGQQSHSGQEQAPFRLFDVSDKHTSPPFICLHCSLRILPGQFPNIRSYDAPFKFTSIGTHAATQTLFHFRSLFSSVTFVRRAPVCLHCFLSAFFL